MQHPGGSTATNERAEPDLGKMDSDPFWEKEKFGSQRVEGIGENGNGLKPTLVSLPFLGQLPSKGIVFVEGFLLVQ